MKKIIAVLGLALLMGCGNNPNGGCKDCPRKDKGCGKSLTSKEAPASQQKEVVQESAATLESGAPSK